MNELTIDKDFFDKVIPAAKQPDDEIFNEMQAAIETATDMVETKLTGFKDISGNQELVKVLKEHICYVAMYSTVGERDLILTNNGFGVVSNQNVAPASKDRVAAFKDSLMRSADKAMEKAIDMLRSVDGWCDTVPAMNLINSVMFYSWHLSSYAGIVKPTRETLENWRPKIFAAEVLIAKIISMEQLQEVIAAFRKADVTPEFQALHLLMLKFVGGYIAKLQQYAMQRMRDEIYNYVESHLESFSLYKNSAAYKANHFKPYENKKEDSTYFFG